eukprot:1158246-Pelagomonas_calceolata.AAC.5
MTHGMRVPAVAALYPHGVTSKCLLMCYSHAQCKPSGREPSYEHYQSLKTRLPYIRLLQEEDGMQVVSGARSLAHDTVLIESRGVMPDSLERRWQLLVEFAVVDFTNK